MKHGMIVTTGKVIKVEYGYYFFERSSEHPGAVILRAQKDNATISLPTNVSEMEAFIAAYRRTVAEDVGYRKSECE